MGCCESRHDPSLGGGGGDPFDKDGGGTIGIEEFKELLHVIAMRLKRLRSGCARRGWGDIVYLDADFVKKRLHANPQPNAPLTLP